jgi:ArsR family transcriptional regulator
LQAEFAVPGPQAAADDARLQEVRRVRRETFTRHGVDGRQGQIVPGRSWAAWSRALGLLLPPLEVADLGCGDGYLSIEAAAWAHRVIAIDRSADVLRRGRALAARRRAKNIEWKRGDLERVPLPDASVDVALLSQALHHAADPGAALREAFRIVRPAGSLLILDLKSHGEQWVRTTLGDRWLGFSEDDLRTLCQGAGFEQVTIRTGTRTPGDPFVVFVAAATRPDVPAASRRPRAARQRTSP